MRNLYKLLSILSIIIVTTCEDRSDNFGSVKVSITTNQSGGPNNRITEALSSDITKVTISISSVDPVNIDVTPGQTITETIDGVVVGEQTVKIDLKNSSGTILYTQTRTVNVTAGQTSSPSFPANDFDVENVVIVVSSPNGDENWEPGSTHDITWTTSHSSEDISIALYKSGSVVETLSSDESNDGSYSWTISSELEEGTDYRVRISSISDGSVFDESDGDFSLTASPSIMVTSPNGGEDWEPGSTHDIMWSSVNVSGNVKIELYKSGSVVEILSSDESNDGSYSWTISSELEEGTNYQVRISSISDSGVYDESDGDFTLSRLLWSYVYDYAGVTDWGNSVIEVSDGYWTTGVWDEQMRLFKTNFAGNLITEIEFDDYGYSYFAYGNQILEADDGSLYLIGGGYSSGIDEYAILVVKTDDFGTEIWRQYLGIDSWGYGGLINDNSEIIIYGEEDGNAVVYSLSQDGTNFDVVAFDDNMDRAKGIVKVDGGGYYIAFSKDYETKILKTNDNFVGETEVNIAGYCRSLSLANDGTLLTTLQTSENEHTYMKFDPLTGQTIWSGTVAGLYSGFQAGDSYYFVGHSDDGMSLFLRLNENGDIITTRSFGPGILSGYAVTSDGGLIFTGTTSDWNDEQSDTPLYKTNLDGELGDAFNLVHGPGHIFSIGINKDFNLAPVQMDQKQSD